jgi:hypothetical protein
MTQSGHQVGLSIFPVDPVRCAFEAWVEHEASVHRVGRRRRQQRGGVPLVARAQQSEGVRRIAVLQILAENDPESVARHAAFEQTLQAFVLLFVF